MIANNMANALTNGFKRDLAIVQSRNNAAHEDPAMIPYKIPVLDDQGGGVFLQGGGVDLTQGSLKTTNNLNDLALDGRGFFALKGDNDQTVLTRDGSFTVNDQGTLVHAASGRAVLGEDGQPITLDPTLDMIKVDKRGQLTQYGGAGGGGDATTQLKLLDVKDPRQLVKMGRNLLTVNDPSVLTPMKETTQVLQGNLEMSGVDPIVEMVNMMSGQRIFDANAKMISLQDTTLQSTNGIGRIA